MRSSSVCIALLLSCSSSQTTHERPPSTPKRTADRASPVDPASPDAPGTTTPSSSDRDAATARLTGQEVIDRLVPETERVEVTDALAKALDIRLRDLDLWVTDGSRWARLGEQATELTRVTHARSKSGQPTIELEYLNEMLCTEPKARQTLTAQALLARLENAAAMKRHREKDFAAAARGFARAAHLDPSLTLAWTNLACALAMDGKVVPAAGALEPLIADDPIPTYFKALRDPELAAIRDAPELTALHAPTPGNASIEGLTMVYSEHLSMVALRREEESWGSSQVLHDLQIFSTKTGEHVHTLPLIGWGESSEDGKILRSSRARVDARLEAAQTLLRDLGFSASPQLEIASFEGPQDHGEGDFYRTRFPRAGLGIAIRDGAARVLRRNEVLGVARDLYYSDFWDAGYDPDARVAFIEWYTDIAEGCDDGDATGFEIVLVEPFHATTGSNAPR